MSEPAASAPSGALVRKVFGVPVYRWLLLAGVWLGLVFVSFHIRAQLDIEWSLESLRAFVTALGFWGPLTYIGILTFRFLFLIPTGLLLLAGGVLFGPIFGTMYAGLGMFFSGLLKYAFATIVGRDAILGGLPPRLQTWVREMAKGRMSAWALAGVCAYPFFPKHIFQFAAILSGMGLLTYICAVLAGSFARAFLFANVGEALYSGAGLALATGLLLAGLVLPMAVPSWRRWMLAPLKSPEAKEAPA
ncbi:MAG: VTT domain-containing protein [Pseudomonadota bacterium]